VSTFAEIAAEARTIAPSQPLGAIDYCRMIARLAEALDEFATEMRGHVHSYVGSTENYMQGVVGRPALTGEPVVFQETL
jgi:hypothetical protein